MPVNPLPLILVTALNINHWITRCAAAGMTNKSKTFDGPLVPVDRLHAFTQFFHGVQQTLGTAKDGEDITQVLTVKITNALVLLQRVQLLLQIPG